jgi:hypothetical protein
MASFLLPWGSISPWMGLPPITWKRLLEETVMMQIAFFFVVYQSLGASLMINDSLRSVLEMN